jgi:hypothetical protein
MGKIVLHAGMWKTGSTSIQWWLGRRGAELFAESGIAILRASIGPGGTVRVTEHRGARRDGAMHSNEVGRFWGEHPKQRRKIAGELFSQLAERAERHGTVVISGEALSRPFWMLDEAFLEDLNGLSDDHDVHVAYYVRPQHTAIEASWRGFQRPASPAIFIANRSRMLDYDETYTFARRTAPGVRFVARPFRRDLLHEANVVADFAHHFLGLRPSEDMDVWENRGLPLDAINLLRSAPQGQLWRSPEDNRAAVLTKELLSGVELPDSERAKLSRLVLQQACHDRFEPSNQRLIATLGWEIDAFVPPVTEDIGEASFERLDELWRPQASEAEQALFHHAMARLLSLAGQQDAERQASVDRRSTTPGTGPPRGALRRARRLFR